MMLCILGSMAAQFATSMLVVGAPVGVDGTLHGDEGVEGCGMCCGRCACWRGAGVLLVMLVWCR